MTATRTIPCRARKTPSCIKRYESLALRTKDVWFVGRLATYRYYNMDQVVARRCHCMPDLAARLRLMKPPISAGRRAPFWARISGSADPANRSREVGGDAGRLEVQHSAAMGQFGRFDGMAAQRIPAGDAVTAACESGTRSRTRAGRPSRYTRPFSAMQSVRSNHSRA